MNRTVVNIENVPLELKLQPHWLLWKYEDSGGKKPKKVPYNPVTRGKASTTASNTWSDFETTLAVYNFYKEYNGIGFVLTSDLGIVGIDLDGEINLDLVDRFDSYSELTPSKNGLRIFIKADTELPTKRINNFEFYNDKRFFTVTGETLSECNNILDKSIEFEDFYNGLLSEKALGFVPDTPKQLFKSKRDWHSGLEMEEILKIIWKHEKCIENKLRFEGIYPARDKGDTSWTEWHLARCFAYHTRDYDLALALMYQSGLDKKKWARNSGAGHNRIEVTVYNALNEVMKQYGSVAPNYKKKVIVSNMNLENFELYQI